MLSKSRVRLMEPAVPILDQLNYVEGVDIRLSEQPAFLAIRPLKYSFNKLVKRGVDVLEPLEAVRDDDACVSC